MNQRLSAASQRRAHIKKRLVRKLDEEAVRLSYARWAPVYDAIFRGPFYFGRAEAVKRINMHEGRILEVGVGTGMSLPLYKNDLEIVGIDLSPEMLARAQSKTSAQKLTNVKALLPMDACEMALPDNSYDCTVAMFVMSVAPDPIKVLREMERVTRPGGAAFVVNHFSTDKGLRSHVEKWLHRHAGRLGWNPEFPRERILGQSGLELVNEKRLSPFGLFTLLELRKPD